MLVDRTYYYEVADPEYVTRYNKHLLRKAVLTNTTASPPLNLSALTPGYAVREPFEDVYQGNAWWASGDPSGANEFLAMPHLPFFSNCAGKQHSSWLLCLYTCTAAASASAVVHTALYCSAQYCSQRSAVAMLLKLFTAAIAATVTAMPIVLEHVTTNPPQQCL
jgi:hypothetical protein